jgi:hypothetical protein
MVEEKALPSQQEETKPAAGAEAGVNGGQAAPPTRAAQPAPRTAARKAPAAKEKRSYPASRHRSFGRVYEILCVASLTGCFLALTLDGDYVGPGLRPFLLIVLASAAVATFAAAANRAAAAGRAEKEQTDSVKYKVTWARLRILEQADVPPDVRGALARLVGREMTKDELIEELALGPKTDLGLERTNEFAEKILKYTKLDATPDKKPDTKSGDEPDSKPDANGAKHDAPASAGQNRMPAQARLN